jgi:hypothetical protein
MKIMRRFFATTALQTASFLLALTIVNYVTVNHAMAQDDNGTTTTAVDFLVTSDYSNVNDTSQHFVARIIDDAMIAVARRELNQTEDFRIIAGDIVKSPVDWNPGWSYHLSPESIHFGDFFIEVCDASATYVEEHLDEVGGAVLPNSVWCPWGTRVLEELQVIPNYTAPPPVTTTSGAAMNSSKTGGLGSILFMILVLGSL